jgi:hypothetical protein
MENYWEGWGFSDRIPVTISATPRKIEILKLELAKSFPDNQVDELDSRNFRFYVKEEQLKKLKKFVATLNGKVYYEKGGNVGEMLATSNPYIGGAKVIQGIAPESVSAIDKKMASRINPDPNRPIFFSNGGKTPKLQVGDKVIHSKDPKKRVGFISKITGSGMAFVDFVREGKVELFDLEDLKKTIRIPYSNGGKTPKEKNITNYKNAVESYINDKYKEDVNWSESMILLDDRSEETKIKKAVIVTKQGNEYEVYHDDIFSMFMSGGQVPRKMELYDAVLYEGKQYDISIKNGVVGLKNLSQGAWGSDYPFIPLSKVDINDVTDMYGNKVEIADKYDNGGSVGQNDYSVARIILQQLGGQGKLVVMTGANNFIAFSNGVSFKLKSRKANYVKITLNGNDLYDIQFQKLFGMKSKIVAEYNDIYFDQLIPIVEKETGMYLKMFKKGGMVSTQNRDMVISQLKAIHHHEGEMLNTLKNSGEVEAWVLAKISNASNDLSNVAHYLEFKE